MYYMTQELFFRVKVKEASPFSAMMIKNLGRVTKTWQLKKGHGNDYRCYPDLEIQEMIKKGDQFVPAEPKSITENVAEVSDNPDQKDTGSQDVETVQQRFNDVAIEQLKAYLSAKGVPSNELRGLAKADLIARAESL